MSSSLHHHPWSAEFHHHIHKSNFHACKFFTKINFVLMHDFCLWCHHSLLMAKILILHFPHMWAFHPPNPFFFYPIFSHHIDTWTHSVEMKEGKSAFHTPSNSPPIHFSLEFITQNVFSLYLCFMLYILKFTNLLLKTDFGLICAKESTNDDLKNYYFTLYLNPAKGVGEYKSNLDMRVCCSRQVKVGWKSWWEKFWKNSQKTMKKMRWCYK